MDGMNVAAMYDLSYTVAKPLLSKCEYPWEALPDIGDFIKGLGETLSDEEYTRNGEFIWVSKEAKILPGVYIGGPTIIGPGSELRPGAFIRGNVIVGKDCVVGNSTELKNVILFDKVQVPHYNYVGDSILGYRAHMGAGAITSNVKQDKSLVTISTDEDRIETSLKKFGAMLGDNVEVGCNSVMNPGTVVGRNSRIYPLSFVRGFVPENSIYKNDGTVVEIRN